MGFDKKLASLFSKKKNRKKKKNNPSRCSSKGSIDNSSSQLGGGGDTIIESIQTFDCDDAEPCCSKYLTENELANQHTEKNNKQTRTPSRLFTRNGLRRQIDFNEPLQPLEFSDDEDDGLNMTTSIEELPLIHLWEPYHRLPTLMRMNTKVAKVIIMKMKMKAMAVTINVTKMKARLMKEDL